MIHKAFDARPDLRQRAEALFLAGAEINPEASASDQVKQLIHELRVHQIELEMQNEELRSAQEQLDDSQARYFDLYDLAPVGYLTLSEKRMIREVNLAAATMLGVERGTLVGQPISLSIFKEDRPLFSQHLKRVVEQGQLQSWDMRLVRADRTPFWVHLKLSPERNGEFSITLNDITQSKQAEAELLAAHIDLEKRVRARTEQLSEALVERMKVEEALIESNHHLETLSITDGLTGLANRRHFDRILTLEHARHARSGAELSLIMLDVDHFKEFNDAYGHLAGDQCLQKIASVIAACTSRPADLAVRYGGEEFACILPDTDSCGAVIIAEKIRHGILSLAIPQSTLNTAQCVTASQGIVTVRCRAGDSEMDIVAQADDLLYQAKASGRNRVKCASSCEVALPADRNAKANFVHLVWKDAFCSGQPPIDQQHQGLFSDANDLLEAALSARPAAELSLLMDKLLDDVRQHTYYEEGVLEKAGFPGFSAHAAEHVALLTKGLELARQFSVGVVPVNEVFQFLVYDLVMLHILAADREFFAFLNDQS